MGAQSKWSHPFFREPNLYIINTIIIAVTFQPFLQKDLIKSASHVRDQQATFGAANIEQIQGDFSFTFTHKLPAPRSLPQTQNASARRIVTIIWISHYGDSAQEE